MKSKLLTYLQAGCAICAWSTAANGSSLQQLQPQEIQEAIRLLHTVYVHSDQLDEKAVAKAQLEGILIEYSKGASLESKNEAASQLPKNFFAELFPNQIGYIRLGDLNADNLKKFADTWNAFDALTTTPIALILDLRATASSTNDSYKNAAKILEYFIPRGKELFSVIESDHNKIEYAAHSEHASRFLKNAKLVALIDQDTAGAGEAIAVVLRNALHTMVIGNVSAGKIVGYSMFDLSKSGKNVLKVATAQIQFPPDHKALFPESVRPDLQVNQPAADKQKIFTQCQAEALPQASPAQPLTTGNSMVPFVFETERSHFSEQALSTGANPELDNVRDAQNRRRAGFPKLQAPLSDAPLQRVVDWILAEKALE